METITGFRNVSHWKKVTNGRHNPYRSLGDVLISLPLSVEPVDRSARSRAQRRLRTYGHLPN